MVHSHTVLTAVIAVGVATSALAAPIDPVPSRPTTVTGTHPQNVPTRPHTISRQVTSDPQLPPVVPGKSLNAREFDVIVEEDSHRHHPHPHHHHEEFEEEHHDEEFKFDFEEEHRYPHHHHHHHHHHHGGEDFEVDVEFDEHHPHHPHHHHGEEFEVDVEFGEHRPHRHHGEEKFEIEVEEHHHHHHHHHHGEEHFEHKHHGHHAHHHQVEVVPIPIPVPVEHKNFEHSMGRPPKVVKDEVWVVATEGNHVGIGRRQDQGGLPTPAPAPGSSPQGQKLSTALHNGVIKHFPLKSGDPPNNAAAGDPSQLSRREGPNPSAPPPLGTTSTANSGSPTEETISSSTALPMSVHAGDGSASHLSSSSTLPMSLHVKGGSAQSSEWKNIKEANKQWRSDMDESGGDWEKFLKTKTGKAVAAKDDPELVALVEQALEQHSNPNNSKSHSSPTLNRRSGMGSSGSSSSASPSPSDGDSSMSSSQGAAGLGATGSGATSSSGTSGALSGTSGSADPASPSGAATTTSAGYSSAHKQSKEQHREAWRKFKEANPSVKADLKSAKGDVEAFLQTPSGKALGKENEAFQKFVKTHVVEHHKKHGQNHHHQSASSEQPAPLDGSSSASSSSSSPASGANPAPVARSVLAARMGFAAHGSSSSTLPTNPRHGGHHHHGRSMPTEAGDASGTSGQTSALPIQSSSMANGPGMDAVNGATSSFSGTPSSYAISGPLTSGLPPSAPPNGNGQGPHPQGPGPHGGPHGFEGGPMAHENPFGGPYHQNHNHPDGDRFGAPPPPSANGNTGFVPGTPPNFASGASSLPPPPSGATSQGMPGAPGRRALQRVRRSTPYGNFGADLD
ncbi:hypothetical protein F5876DRAFT_73787 [Lentinula aff. lateritia]|uniref:Uncharacterized protein n=1 Tax=Lentinula aff. lateritia TaxID=2804960 RepID=A0ACC1U966_9AGAR|nr:hypothetical protein F5876DRAFT_73787 [Lentinula aff. lateritia]